MAKAEEKVKTEKKKENFNVTYFTDTQVDCICGNKFTIASNTQGPVKVEICYACHPFYNPDKAIKKVIKGRMEKFLEKQKRIDTKAV